jgi:hypothetical protein
MFEPTDGGGKTCNYLLGLSGRKFEVGNLAESVKRN